MEEGIRKKETRKGATRKGENIQRFQKKMGESKCWSCTNALGSSEELLDDKSTDEEDCWTCQECSNDDGVAADYVGCDICEHWFHKKCAKKFELDIFSCKFCF